MYTQMCIPGLHLSLGIYNRIWSLIKGACTELDLKLAEHLSGDSTPSGNTYDHFSTLLRKKELIQMEFDTQKSYAAVLDEMITYSTLTMANAQTDSYLRKLRKEAADTHSTLRKMVSGLIAMLFLSE